MLALSALPQPEEPLAIHILVHDHNGVYRYLSDGRKLASDDKPTSRQLMRRVGTVKGRLLEFFRPFAIVLPWSASYSCSVSQLQRSTTTSRLT